MRICEYLLVFIIYYCLSHIVWIGGINLIILIKLIDLKPRFGAWDLFRTIRN